jgi:aspartate/methionine/tyrosine aminotransferase
MTVRRLAAIPGFSIDRVAAAAGDDPEVLRLENLDTDVAPPAAAVRRTAEVAGADDANSWLPFTGKASLRRAVAAHVQRRSGVAYDPDAEITITGGEGDAMLDALLCTTDPGDGVIVTDPTYAGIVNRVRLAGAVPQLVPFRVSGGEWRLDLEALAATVDGTTRAVFLPNPAMPTGALLDSGEWAAVADLCRERDLWLVYVSWMEAILFDGRTLLHPAALPGMRDRVVTVGTVSMEQRMIGWRIGWVVAPEAIAADVMRVHIYNGLVAGGIAQEAAVVALAEPGEDFAGCVAEWERRRDAVLDQLAGYPVVRPAGGWSLLLETPPLGVDPAELSRRLLAERVAATPMTGWGGDVAARYLRLVYSNEPVARLALLRPRLEAALSGRRPER